MPAHPAMLEQAVPLLAAMVLFTSFALLAQNRLLPTIHVFAWQGALLALTTLVVGLVTREPNLYISALLTLALKAALVPWILQRMARRLGVTRQVETIIQPSLILLAAAALVVFSYYVALPIEQLSTRVTRNAIAVSMAVVLLGFLMMITRRQAITQVIGFMSLENGLLFAAVTATYGMPMVVELGIGFDVLVATVLFGIFFLRIRESIDSLDVDRLNRLSEAAEPAEVEE